MAAGIESDRRVLLAIDGSAHSERAFEWARRNFLREGDVLTILHVYPPPVLPSMSFAYGFNLPYDVWQKNIEQAIAEARDLITKYEQRCKESNIRYQTLLLHGAPGEMICASAEELNPVVLILGSRGLGAVKRTLIGSVSDYCTHNCPCPVIVIKNKEEEKGGKGQ